MTSTTCSSVTLCDLPKESVLQQRILPSDFVDCYCVGSHTDPRRAAEIITNFPGWAKFLVRVRSIVTAPFGLANDGPDAANKLGPFPVEVETDHEIIAGFNDKHLNFRISVFSHKGRVSLGTWVHPHNLGGRLYLKLIMPFHILIARDALKRVANDQST